MLGLDRVKILDDMGWGIDFKADIFLNRISIENMYQLEDIIEEKKKELLMCKEQIMMFTSSTPKDIIPEEWKEEPIRFLQNEVDSILEDYNENMNLLRDLYYYKEYLENKKD